MTQISESEIKINTKNAIYQAIKKALHSKACQ